MHRRLATRLAVAKLREFVIAMMPGDEMSSERAMKISGLSRRRCDAMLDSLTRAGLTMRLRHDAYIRATSTAYQSSELGRSTVVASARVAAAAALDAGGTSEIDRASVAAAPVAM
jgi:hypothetical protein